MKNKMNINAHIKAEIAVEIMAAKIAQASQNGYDVNSNQMKELLKERDKMYDGDADIIEKIINIYGPEIKNNYKGVNNNE